MRLINTARATSPQLAREQEGKFLDEQSLMVRYQQAEKDFETAEFYRRTGHPGSAWFYYELVKRRYAGIRPWADLAVARQQELKAELDEMKNPTTMASTRRFWKQYVLGHEMPAVKDVPGAPGIKELPEPRPAALPAGERCHPAERPPGPGCRDRLPDVQSGATPECVSVATRFRSCRVAPDRNPVPTRILDGTLRVTMNRSRPQSHAHSPHRPGRPLRRRRGRGRRCASDGHVGFLGYTTAPNYDPGIRTVYVPIFKSKVLETTPYRGVEFTLTRRP